MGVFSRLKNLWRSRKAELGVPNIDSSQEDVVPGDIIDLDLTHWTVIGTVSYFDPGHTPHRFAYYLQSGSEQACLILERGRSLEALFARFVEGSLDNPQKVPTQLNVSGVPYRLEWYRKDQVVAKGSTDFRSHDRVIYWRYLGGTDKDSYFILQWQDGKFVALEAERLPSAAFKIMKVGSPQA